MNRRIFVSTSLRVHQRAKTVRSRDGEEYEDTDADVQVVGCQSQPDLSPDSRQERFLSGVCEAKHRFDRFLVSGAVPFPS